jgi:hypothetical protein
LRDDNYLQPTAALTTPTTSRIDKEAKNPSRLSNFCQPLEGSSKQAAGGQEIVRWEFGPILLPNSTHSHNTREKESPKLAYALQAIIETREKKKGKAITIAEDPSASKKAN